MTTTQDQPENDPKRGVDGADALRLAELRAGARRLLETQRARIRSVENTLGEQATALIELANRQQVDLSEQEQTLQIAREKLNRQHAAAEEAQAQAESFLEEARAGLTEALETQTELRRQLANAQQELAEKTKELEQARAAGGAAESNDEELERLVEERNALRTQLIAAVEANTSVREAQEEANVLRERLESAVEELRELRIRNDDLAAENKKLLAQGPPAGTVARIEAGSEGFDWETQKLALMKQMEADFDESDADAAANRLSVEGAIRITDEVVAEKDREIEELKELLANQSSSIGDVAVGAAAIADMLDQDELIRDERENLRRVQEEWREKLRQAEVEISVERAKFARERIELDERIRSFEQQKAALGSATEQSGGDGKPTRGNWLSRLGLKEES